MPPQSDLLGDFTPGDPRFQELKESRTSHLLPLDAQTGGVVSAQDGVVAPNIGSSLEPWNLIYANGLVVGGEQIAVRDLSNFAPIFITRAEGAPATGQHDQTYIWPFSGLTRALVHIVGPQSGGSGSGAGLHVTRIGNTGPPFGTSDFYLDGIFPGLSPGDEVSREALDSAFARNGLDGGARMKTFLLSGLTLGSTFSLSFGKGGAGGAGSTDGIRAASGLSNALTLWQTLREGFPGGVGEGASFLSVEDFGVAVGNGLGDPRVTQSQSSLTTRPISFEGERLVSEQTIDGRTKIGDTIYGAGGSAPPAISRAIVIAERVPLSEPGNPGFAGHDGFVLIFPRI